MEIPKFKSLDIPLILLGATGGLFWFVTVSGFTFDPFWMPPFDSFSQHFSSFRYIADSIRQLHQIPSWLWTYHGGVWMSPLINNFLLIAPHRMVGYLLATLTSLPSPVIYKVSLFFVGQPLFLLGTFFLARQLEFSKWKSLLVASAFAASPLMAGTIHQEQALGTLLFIPWIWGALIRASREPKYLITAFALLGMSFNLHYPQILMVYWGAVFTFAIFLNRELRTVVWGWLRAPVTCLGALVAFLLCASPLFYSYFTFSDQLVSKFRGQGEGIFSTSWKEYFAFNTGQLSSLNPSNLELLIGMNPTEAAEITRQDRFLLFGHGFYPFALIGLLFSQVRGKWWSMALIGLLAAASIGIYGPLPALLWRGPAMSMFRQWYHFLPLLVGHLIFFSVWICLTPGRFVPRRKNAFAVAGLLGFGFFTVQAVSGYYSWLVPATFVTAAILLWFCDHGEKFTRVASAGLFAILMGLSIASSWMISKQLSEMFYSQIPKPQKVFTDDQLLWYFSEQGFTYLSPGELFAMINRENLIVDYIKKGRRPMMVAPLASVRGFKTQDEGYPVVARVAASRLEFDLDFSVQSTPHGLKFDIADPSADLIHLDQFNDGNWEVNSPGGNWSLREEGAGFGISVQRGSATPGTSFYLNRKPGHELWLILLAYLGLLGSCFVRRIKV